jgi:hypothetical protein
VEYLTRLLLSQQLPSIDVLLMANGVVRDRALAAGYNCQGVITQIDNPMQGRTDGARADRDYYPGDEHIHNERPQLQVHFVRPRGCNIATTALALYIPEEDRFNLRYVVRDD